MICLEHLKYSYDKKIFKKQYTRFNIDIDFLNIKEQERIGLIGLNGSGKSTLLKILMGVLSPVSGSILINGYNPSKQRKEYVKHIGVVWGNRSTLFADLTPYENFSVLTALYKRNKVSTQHRIDESIEQLHCQDFINRPVRKLSLGQRMKIEIIAALLHEPNLLFLDEPFIGLDFYSRELIIDYINAYSAKKNTTLLLTSHNLNDIAQLCHSVIALDSGTVVFKDSIAALTQPIQRTYDITFEGYNTALLNSVHTLVEKHIVDIALCDDHSITVRSMGNYSLAQIIRLLAADNADFSAISCKVDSTSAVLKKILRREA